jgi:hypothetical protein
MFKEKRPIVETLSKNQGPPKKLTNFTFPVVRRVFPSLLAQEIVSVQPMTAPVGGVFYQDYSYGMSPVWKSLRKAGLKKKVNI